jgi:hypothetical protein
MTQVALADTGFVLFGVMLTVADPKRCDVLRRRPPHRCHAAVLGAQSAATIKSAPEE